MAFFHKQNSAGENPLVRRMAQERGEDLCKTRPRGFKFKPSRNNFNSCPFTQIADPALAVGFIATNYRHYHHMGNGLITL
jgi:hypothetical protein